MLALRLMKRFGLLLIAVFSLQAFGQDRKESLKSFELAFGAQFPSTRAFEKKDAHYSLGVGYIWDVDVAFIELRADHTNRFGGSPTQHYTAATIGGNYIFLDQDLWGLFAGLNVGMGFIKVPRADMKGGFHMGGDFGVLFLRNADVNLDLRLRLAYNTASVNDSHPFFIGIITGIHF